MSNLNNNTAQLEALLAKVNTLPEAGSGGTDTSDATATAEEIFKDKTAYTADGKVTGTFTIENELTEQETLLSDIITLLDGKAVPGGGSIETCMGTLIQSGPPVVPLLDGTVYYVDGSGNFQTTNTPGTITVMKNSILVGNSSGNGQNISGDITSIGGVKVRVMAYHVTGDFSLQI